MSSRCAVAAYVVVVMRYGPQLKGSQGLLRNVVLQTVPPENSVHERGTASANVLCVIMLKVFVRFTLFERKTRLAPYARIRDKPPSSKDTIQRVNNLIQLRGRQL